MNKLYLTVGFSKPRKFKLLSWLIRKVEKTQFSHVYIMLHSRSLARNLYYQASGLEVNFCGEITFHDKNTITDSYLFEITEEIQKDMLKTAVDLAGKPYGIKQLIGMSLVRLCMSIGIKTSNPFSDGDSTYVCSELVAKMLNKHLNYDFKDLDELSPKDIYDKLNQR